MDRVLAGHIGVVGSNESTRTPKKYVLGPTYWKGGEKICYSGGVLLEPWLLYESRTQHHHVTPVGETYGAKRKIHMGLHHGGIVVGKAKDLMEKGVSCKKDSE